ncbi:hypothetical protein BSKO_12853 [Bryopsis sp. KO-2023]|nr:hypothetical protein BSKO_12853 [Bryopsis sp. KO-2023]
MGHGDISLKLIRNGSLDIVKAKTSWTKSRAPEPRLVQPIPLRSSPPSGPLLIFCDTSALLGLIGISRKGQRSVVFTFDWLQKLCMKSVFGKNLPANERVFFVLCDSVAKQLDGLKEQNPYVGHSIRKLSMALEERNFEETSEESGVTPSGPSYAVSEAESMATSVDLDACEVTENELVPLVRAKLTEWEGLVKSYQNSMC